MRLDAAPRTLSSSPRLALCLALSASLLCNPVASQAQAPVSYPSTFATPLPVDRGATAVWQSLQKLHTRSSLILIVAHPDDEDSGMLAYESRDQGVDTTLLTLNRGEGGQNVMSSDYWDQLGLLRTQELLAAGNYFGVHQAFTRVADFGFSKSLDEALKTWGHDRVLYDVVRQVRITRPLVVTSVFAGNVSDGHGHHQTAGVMAQEVFNAAADPKVFPDQIKAGLLPWAPLKVYARVPFARVTDKGIYDYATGHWETPVRFKNYTNNTWIEGVPSATLSIPEGKYNALLARSYLTLAREGLAEQKSQNGGISIPAPRPFASPYHLYASRVNPTLPQHEESYFDGIDTSLPAIADYAPKAQQPAWKTRLTQLNALVETASTAFDASKPEAIAPILAQGLAQTNTLLTDLAASKLPADAKYNMTHELLIKQKQFNDALGQSLSLSILATISNGTPGRGGFFGENNPQPGAQTVVPGEKFAINLHISDQSTQPIEITSTQLVSHAGEGWIFTPAVPAKGTLAAGDAKDQLISATVPKDAEITRPYFIRPNLEQPYYDIQDPRYLGLPTTLYPLTAELHYTFHGVPAQLEGVVQTMHRYVGPGPLPEPLLVAPAISVTVSPHAGVVPVTNTSLHLQVTVRSSVDGPAKGTLLLNLPLGWHSKPQSAPFSMASSGDEEVVNFDITPTDVKAQPYTITAVADYDGRQYSQGFVTTGYPGIRPYPSYRNSVYRTTGVDIKIAPGLKVAYVNGTGDEVARSLQDLGINVTFLSPQDIANGDLSAYDAIILGIRSYAARTELKSSNNRILEYVHNGGTVIVQYQTPEYDHNYGPYPISISGDPEKVVEEDNKVTLIPNDPVLNFPNKITEADFNGWVEERGHGFARTWAPEYKAPTEMHDVDQDPQRGGLLYASYGKGTYVYLSYAFFRQMPDGVPGSFRIMANLLSIGKNPALHTVAAK
ncbi:PIG-L family deacetylase [Granulicella sp. dw_53]|uniref:PIG-L family deacetylase n=1 Tax=Granulicella sp. dw_53 TaxID=2719792 RepID=UPI001BD5D926|nr:PIG-L family deacetylase [Granulicella sp. dw_53]